MRKSSSSLSSLRHGKRKTGRSVRLRRLRRVTAGLVHHRAPAWSIDGRHLASRLGEGLDSFWMIVDRKGRVARVLEGPAEGTASFAPDGALAYCRVVGATSEIWLLPAVTASTADVPGQAEGPRRLLGGDGRLYRDPAFSPDGRYLAYVADDGPAGTARRLWLLDLVMDEHHLLVAAMPGPSAPSRLAHPAWAPTGDVVYFEAQTEEGSCVGFVPLVLPMAAASARALGDAGAADGMGDGGSDEVGRARSALGAVPNRLTGPGYRRPAPAAVGLLLCERESENGESTLVLIEHAMPPATRSAADAETQPGCEIWELTSQLPHDCVRDPAIVHGKRGPQLAFAAPTRSRGAEPARFDVYAARVDGLGVPSTVRTGAGTADASAPTAGKDEGGANKGHGAHSL